MVRKHDSAGIDGQGLRGNQPEVDDDRIAIPELGSRTQGGTTYTVVVNSSQAITNSEPVHHIEPIG